MSEENVDVVRSIYAAWNRGDYSRDIDLMFRDIDAEVVLDWSNSDALDSGVYHGHAALRTFALSRSEAWEDRRFFHDELIDAPPDRVIGVGRMRGRGRASGVEVEARAAIVWTLRDRKITRVTLYRTKAEALKAVGLE